MHPHDEPVRQFEELLRELQQTVRRLEEDDLTLEESISAYERSVGLANSCSRMLDEAELRGAQIDSASRAIREEATIYRVDSFDAARLLLDDDEDDLADLLDSDE